MKMKGNVGIRRMLGVEILMVDQTVEIGGIVGRMAGMGHIVEGETVGIEGEVGKMEGREIILGIDIIDHHQGIITSIGVTI